MNTREIIVFLLVVAVVLIGGLLLLGLVWAFGGFGFGMLGPGMTGGCCGGFGWLLLCLAPLGLLAFLVLIAGLAWLVFGQGRQR